MHASMPFPGKLVYESFGGCRPVIGYRCFPSLSQPTAATEGGSAASIVLAASSSCLPSVTHPTYVERVRYERGNPADDKRQKALGDNKKRKVVVRA